MGAIKINGSTSGSTTITAPATGSDETIELFTALAAKAPLASPTFTGTVTIPDVNFGTWNTWTPTWTNLTVGNGTVVARYVQIGKFVRAQLSLTFGSTTSISSAVSVSIPVTASTAAVGVTSPIGNAEFRDTGTNSFSGIVGLNNSTSVTPRQFSVSGSLVVEANNMTSTTPFTWTTSDVLFLSFSYEAA